MVEYVKRSNMEQVSYLKVAFAGGVAGSITRAIAQPLDVIKVRFQLQLEPMKHGSKYYSITQAITAIVKEEGPAALWSGHVPAQLLSVSYGVIQFTAFEKLEQLCQEANPKWFNNHKPSIHFTCGAVAACLGTVASYPFDTVRTRLIAEKKTQKAYRGFVNAFTVMVNTEGPLALYKGLLPTLGQIAPFAGIQFAVYKAFTEYVFKNMSLFKRPVTLDSSTQSTLLANLIAGSIAGLTAKTAVYPFDLIKKRLQIQGFQQHRKDFGRQMYCNGVLECCKKTITEEGFIALYKGFGASAVKALMASALHFAVYDEIKHLLSSII